MIHSKSTDDLIAELNLLDESDAIEAKEVSGNEVGSSIYETICAFSNEPGLGGGVILLGLKKELGQLFPVYKLTGIKDPDKIQSDIVSACQSKFNTPIRPIVKRELIQNRTIVRIDIAELPAEQKPISIKNLGLPRGVLRRIGSSDVHCSQDDLIAFFQDRSHSNYDAHTVRDSSTQDIDPTAIALYRRFIAEHKPTSLVLSMTNDEILYSTTSLKTAESVTRATACGIICFGKTMSLRRFFPSVRADYIRVQGKGWVDDANNRFTSIDFRGPVISIIDRVISAILDDLPKKFALADGGRARRTELPIIPYKAIREAVVNAFMHRNYKIDRPIQIIRYSNRLVIENPGHSMKPQDQFDRNGSIARNPNIAALLNETDFAETKGTGMRTMRLLLQQAGLSSPAFESERESDIFRVTFLFHQLLDEVTLTWLSRYKEHNLSSDECLALAYVKEAGQISNLTLRVCPLTSYLITKPSEHEADGGEVKKRQRLAIEVFEVLGQPSAATEPRKGSFDDPSARQHFETFGRIGALDDLGVDKRQGLLLCVAELRALIAAVGKQLLQKREFSKHRAQDQNAAIAILNVGRMNERVKQQAYRIDENVPLLALDLFSCIVAMRIDAMPPFSALFTLWLSMTAAVGLASRPAASRHFT